MAAEEPPEVGCRMAHGSLGPEASFDVPMYFQAPIFQIFREIVTKAAI